jgi:hypothetical protein
VVKSKALGKRPKAYGAFVDLCSIVQHDFSGGEEAADMRLCHSSTGGFCGFHCLKKRRMNLRGSSWRAPLERKGIPTFFGRVDVNVVLASSRQSGKWSETLSFPFDQETADGFARKETRKFFTECQANIRCSSRRPLATFYSKLLF